jgi:hypothetical protein
LQEKHPWVIISIKHCVTMTNPTEGEKADGGAKDPKHFKSLERRVECQRMGATAAGAVAVAAPWKCKAAVLVERSISICGYAKPAAAGAAEGQSHRPSRSSSVFSKTAHSLEELPCLWQLTKKKTQQPGRITKQMGNGKTQQQQLQQQQCQVPRELHTHATLQTDSSTEFS